MSSQIAYINSHVDGQLHGCKKAVLTQELTNVIGYHIRVCSILLQITHHISIQPLQKSADDEHI